MVLIFQLSKYLLTKNTFNETYMERFSESYKSLCVSSDVFQAPWQ